MGGPHGDIRWSSSARMGGPHQRELVVHLGDIMQRFFNRHLHFSLFPWRETDKLISRSRF